MAQRLVSVDENYMFPTPLEARLDGKIGAAIAPRVMPTGANVDDYRTGALQGEHLVPSAVLAASLTGSKPFGDYPFTLNVVHVNQAAWQFARPGGAGTYTDVMSRKYSPLAPVGWTPWEKELRSADLWPKAYIKNLDTAKTYGTRAYDANSVGAPTADGGNVTILPSLPAATSFIQKAVTRTVPPREFTRVTALSGWNPWKEILGANEYNDATYGYSSRNRRSVVLSKASRRVGGSVGTAGKAAIAITYDHGFANFRDKLLPIHQALGLPCTLAVNPDTLAAGESDGVTYATLQAWAINEGMELANHSRSHGDATTNASIADAILGARELMRSNMPLVPADSYIMPGVSGTQYNGFNGGATDESFYTHEAGRVILDNHAVVTGLVPGGSVELNGTPTIGTVRAGMDTGSFVTLAEAKVAEAIERGAGLIVYMHPSFLDAESRVTTARIRQFLEKVAGYRDAGQLEVLSLTAFGFADSGRARRHDLARASQWVDGKQAIPLADQAWAKGSVREFSVKSSAAGPITLTAVDDTGALSAFKTVTLSQSGTARMVFTVPLNSSTVTLTATGEGLTGHRVLAS